MTTYRDRAGRFRTGTTYDSERARAESRGVPVFSADWIVDREHIGRDAMAVGRDIRSRAIRNGEASPGMAAACARYAVGRHLENRRDYAWVMGGH